MATEAHGKHVPTWDSWGFGDPKVPIRLVLRSLGGRWITWKATQGREERWVVADGNDGHLFHTFVRAMNFYGIDAQDPENSFPNLRLLYAHARSALAFFPKHSLRSVHLHLPWARRTQRPPREAMVNLKLLLDACSVLEHRGELHIVTDSEELMQQACAVVMKSKLFASSFAFPFHMEGLPKSYPGDLDLIRTDHLRADRAIVTGEETTTVTKLSLSGWDAHLAFVGGIASSALDPIRSRDGGLHRRGVSVVEEKSGKGNAATGGHARLKLEGERWVEALQLFYRSTWPPRDAISILGCPFLAALSAGEDDAIRRSNHESERTVISYNIAIKAFEKASAWLQSLDLLHQMRLHDIEKDVISCNTAVSACGKSSQWQLAVAMALWHPDLVGINAAIDACSSVSEWEHSLCLLLLGKRGAQWPLVLLLLQQMKEEQLEGNVMTYNTCISSLSKGSEWTAALRLFDRLTTSSCGCTVTSYGCAMSAVTHLRRSSATYGAVLEALKIVPGRWPAALELMPGRSLQNTIIYNSAITVCAQGTGHEPSVAWRLFKEMQGPLGTLRPLVKIWVNYGAIEPSVEQWNDDNDEPWPKFPTSGVGGPGRTLGACCAMVSLHPDWVQLRKGDKVDVVATMVIYDSIQQNHLMSDLVSRTLFTYHGELPKGMITYSLLHMEVWQPLPRPVLFNAVGSHVLHHQGCTWDSIHEIIEICAGVGGLGLGSMACGFIPMVACDTNDLFLDLYRKHLPIPTVCGDVNDVEVVAKLWDSCPRSTSLGSGIACQPYSSIGDGLGGLDPRSRTLPGTLRAAHFLRSVLIVLECVKPAQKDPYVQQQINSFCRQTGFHFSEVILQLSDAWPCSRARWWCILSAPALGPITMKSLPNFKDITMLGQVMTHVRVWPPPQEEILSLQPHECQAFRVDDTGSTPYMIDAQSILPCPLHSWGSQLRPCACKCRSVGLSAERIQSKGLFGVVVRSASQGHAQGGPRHIHPKECAALVGFDPTIDLDANPLLHLAAMGQIASPVHASWVFGHIASHLDLLQFGHRPLDSVDHLMADRAWLLTKCRKLWPDAGPPDASSLLAQNCGLLKPFAEESLDVFLAYDWWSAPRSVMCLAAALYQLRKQSHQPVGCESTLVGHEGHLPATHPDSPGANSSEEDASSVAHSSCSLVDGTVCYEIKTSSTTTVQELAYAEGILRGWSTICIRNQASEYPVTPEMLVAGQSLCLSRDDNSGEGWCRIDVPPLPPAVSTPEPMECEDEVVPFPACGMPGHVLSVSLPDPSEVPVDDVCPVLRESASSNSTDVHSEGDKKDSPLHQDLSPVNCDELGPALAPAKAFHSQLFGRSPLIHLDREGLCHLGTPYPVDSFQLAALQTQVITCKDRREILDHQDLCWADDEISWHLNRIVRQANSPHGNKDNLASDVIVLPTMLLHGWIHVDAKSILPWLTHNADPASPLVGVINVDVHWIPIIFVPGHPLRVSTFDCRAVDHSKVDQLIAQVQTFTKATEVAVYRAVRMFSHQDGCGPMSLAFIAQALLQKMMPVTNDDVRLLHHHLRDLFVQEYLIGSTCAKPWIWGNGPQITSVSHSAEAPEVPARTFQREFSRVTVKTAGQEFHLYIECGVKVLHTLSLLTSDSIPTLRAVTIDNGIHGMQPLPEDFLATPEDCLLYIDSPSQLLVSENDFVETSWPVVALLHARGILVLWRREGMVGFDVEQAVEQFDFEWEAPLQDHSGRRLVEDHQPPNILFLGATANLRDFWEFVQHRISFQPIAEGFVASVATRDVYPFTHWLAKTGILTLICNCGWHLLTALNVNTDDVPKEIFLLARSDRLAMSTRALCQLVLTRVFLMQLRLYEEAPKLGDPVHVSVKLWKTWLWHCVAGSSDTTQFVHQAWHFAHRMFGDSTPIRLVAYGVQINPDWPMHHYAKPDAQGRLILKVHVVLQLSGGGPPTQPSPRSIHEAFNFDELDSMEQADPTRLISVLVQNMMDRPADEAHLDLESLRDATFRVDPSGFTLISTVAVVVRFMRDLQATGVEPLLRALGWHTVMSLVDHHPPAQVQLHITPRVGVRHIRDRTVKIFMMYALAIRAMPVPRGVMGGIYVKIKLVDSWVLVGHFPEDTTMGTFTRSWYDATSLFGNPSHMSIICASKQVPPNSLLSDHARVNEQGERFVKVFLVLHLQGGSPKLDSESADRPHRQVNRWSRRFSEGRRGVLEGLPNVDSQTTCFGAITHQMVLCDAMGSHPELGSHVSPPDAKVVATLVDEEVSHVLTLEGAVTVQMVLLFIKPDCQPSVWTIVDIFGYPLQLEDSVREHRSVFFSRRAADEHSMPIESPSRVALLISQQHKVAPDEISYYLASRAAAAQFRYLPCLCVTFAAGSHARNNQIRRWIEDIIEHSMAFGQPIASVCLVDEHWTPFVAHVAFDSIQIQTTMDGINLVKAIEVCCHQPHYRSDGDRALPSGDRVLHRAVSSCSCTGPGLPMEEWSSLSAPTPAFSDAYGIAARDALHPVFDPVWITHKLYKKCSPVISLLPDLPADSASGQPLPSDPWLGSCYTSLPGDQLPFQDAPEPITLDQLHLVRSLTVSFSQRMAILSRQDFLWADDELLYHFFCIKDMSQKQGVSVEVIDPMLATSWTNRNHVPAHSLLDLQCDIVLTAIKVQYHWIPLVLVRSSSMVNVHTWEHRARSHPLVSTFLTNVACSWGGLDYRWILYHPKHAIDHACGPMAVSLVLHVVLQVPIPRGTSDVFRTHDLLRRAFVQALSPCCPAPRMWASGVNEQAAEELRPVLIEHGVPKELAQSRSQAAVKAIGGSQILGALASKIPWKQLKTLGNQVKFQFLLPAELQEKIRLNAGQGAVGRPKGAKRGKKPMPPDRNVQIDPSKLCLPEGFFAAGGKSLAQIPLSAVGPLAEGIALVTHSEASPYLQQGQAVSNHPLALLIVQPEMPLQTALAHIPVTVPCKCLANNEPVLLDGVLCQIGNGYVEKGQTNSQIAVDVVKVGTIKFTVYRDEVDGSWETFTEGPLRYIVAKLPLLRLCTQPQCQCAHWHNPEQLEIKEVIVDVWRRQFLQSNFRPETAPQATMYSVCIRLPESLITSILAASGTAGIYSEPRTLDARSVHPDFAMVWMPKMSRSQLNHLKQTTPAAIGLGRVGERVGIRVLSIDAAAVHAALKPETVFLPSGPRHEFLTGPFPFGSDRNSLTRAFKALHWEARPVQPMSSVDAKGSMWLVQANQEPPDTILAMAHGDVVVTRYRPTKEPRDPKSRPIASAATLALCGGQSSDGKDPWINSDPWGGYQATTSRHPVVPEAADGLRQLETKLENKLKKAVLESIPGPSNLMERDDVPDRVFQLESQMTQLLGRQQQLETQAAETAQHQATQIAGIQGQLQTQHQLLHGHIESSQQNIAAMFESQMAQIRTLMAKRPRDEQE
eukprot:s118_g7.t1